MICFVVYFLLLLLHHDSQEHIFTVPLAQLLLQQPEGQLYVCVSSTE